MSASIFESIPDKTLFRFIKMVMENTDFETLISSQDNELVDGIAEAESILGVRGNDIAIDCDYIYNVWQSNSDLFEEDRLIKNLDRPTLKKVEFDWYAWETQWVKLTYRHQVETYGTDKGDIYNYIYGLSSEGDMSYYDGTLIDTDNYDSETTDESIDSNFTIL